MDSCTTNRRARRARCSPAPPSAAVSWRSRIVGVPAVLHPLPHIPMHVVQAPRIRGETAHWHSLPVVPSTATSITVGATDAYLVPPAIRGLRTSSRRVLPLRLAQQPIRLLRLPRQPLHKALGIVPVHVDHWALTPPPAAITCNVLAPWTAAVARTGIPLREGHLILAHRKGRSYRHLVLLALPAHPVRARRHHHHLRTLGAVAPNPDAVLLIEGRELCFDGRS